VNWVVLDLWVSFFLETVGGTDAHAQVALKFGAIRDAQEGGLTARAEGEGEPPGDVEGLGDGVLYASYGTDDRGVGAHVKAADAGVAVPKGDFWPDEYFGGHAWPGFKVVGSGDAVFGAVGTNINADVGFFICAKDDFGPQGDVFGDVYCALNAKAGGILKGDVGLYRKLDLFIGEGRLHEAQKAEAAEHYQADNNFFHCDHEVVSELWLWAYTRFYCCWICGA
jgi:hypothetical protein